ncbi:MAG TPA: DoxX family protein [Pyrinomonadaceae bacterium]
MQLLFLLLLLVIPYLIITLTSRWVSRLNIASTARARVGLSVFFAFTSIGHFIRTEEMSEMLPPFVPYRRGLIYLTGVLELLGATGVWIPRLMRVTGLCLILMLIGVLPSNIYSAVNRVEFGGHDAGPAYLLLRVPFQLFVICWTYYATEQRWFAGRQQGRPLIKT